MLSATHKLVLTMDHLRGSILRETMSYGLLRKIFCDRGLRLLTWFGAAVLFYLPFALYFPVLLLVIGPIIYGLPHLVANLRFVPKMTGVQKTPTFINWASLLFAVVTGWRIYLSTQSIVDYSSNIESWAAGATLIGIIVLGKKLQRTQYFFGILFLAAVIWAAWSFPLKFSASLVLLHNLIAFFYWIASTHNLKERLIALGATVVFLGISTLLFFGHLDFVYQLMQPLSYVEFANVDYTEIGALMYPGGEAHYKDVFHFVVTYAFGQALHYFVWLKAIPDELHEVATPATFKKGLNTLVQDFGQTRLTLLTLFCVLGVGSLLIIPMSQWRLLYFSVAAYHGFLEIAGLPFLTLKKFT